MKRQQKTPRGEGVPVSKQQPAGNFDDAQRSGDSIPMVGRHKEVAANVNVKRISVDDAELEIASPTFSPTKKRARIDIISDEKIGAALFNARSINPVGAPPPVKEIILPIVRAALPTAPPNVQGALQTEPPRAQVTPQDETSPWPTLLRH